MAVVAVVAVVIVVVWVDIFSCGRFYTRLFLLLHSRQMRLIIIMDPIAAGKHMRVRERERSKQAG